jgi:predicted restriction endonuclease
MARKNEFSRSIKRQAITRQGGRCAFCGLPLKTPWTEGEYRGYAHHLQPIRHGGSGDLDNCVYLCWGHHLLLGHGMAPFGIDEQGGSSSTWVHLEKDDFAYWEV